MFKCKICGKKYTELTALYNHIESKHKEMIPKDMSVQQYYYYMKTGKMNGNCVMCKQPTSWNNNTGKYNRFCGNPKCKDEYVKIMKGRMVAKYGKTHLLNDPNKQREMLANRSISGVYEWSDGKHESTYTGSYELDFLKTLDGFFNWDPEDISMPSPHTYTYKYEGEDKFYIPDVFIHSLDLEIEIKDGGDNPNNHYKIQAIDKHKESLKDEVMCSQKAFHYIKITNKNYENFFQFLKEIKKEFEKHNDESKIPRIFKIEDIKGTNVKPIQESLEDVSNSIEKFEKFSNVEYKKRDAFLSLKYDLVKNDPRELQDYLSKLIKAAKFEDDIWYVQQMAKKADDHYKKRLRKHPEMKDVYGIYYDWLKDGGIDKEIKKRRKGGVKLIESFEAVEEKFEPDKLLVWFDKPIQKLKGGKIKLYHGSSVEIKDKIDPISINVGATKFSDPRWSTYFWDNREDAMSWAIMWSIWDVIGSDHIAFGYNRGNGKNLIYKPDEYTEDEYKKYIASNIKPFYVYEVEIDIKDLEIGSCPTIREYTVSKPVEIIRTFKYTNIKGDVFRRFIEFVSKEEFEAYNKMVTNIKTTPNNRGVLLNNMLQKGRDLYRGVIRTDLRNGNIKPGDDLSDYRTIINNHYKKDTYDLFKESYIIDRMEESSISIPQMSYYLQNQYEEDMRDYLNTYKKYYNLMLKEQPAAVKHINEDIRQCLIVIDGLAAKGVENNLVQFAKDDLGEIVKASKKGKPVKVYESMVDDMVNIDDSTNDINLISVQDDNVSISNEIIECRLVYNNTTNKQLFSLRDVDSKLIIENSYVIQRDSVGTHCSVTPYYKDTEGENSLSFFILLNESVDISELSNKINEGITLTNLFKFNDNGYNFIKESCLRLFDQEPIDVIMESADVDHAVEIICRIYKKAKDKYGDIECTIDEFLIEPREYFVQIWAKGKNDRCVFKKSFIVDEYPDLDKKLNMALKKIK